MGLAARLKLGVLLMVMVLSGCAGKGLITPPPDIEPGQMFALPDRGGSLTALAAKAGYVLVGEGHTILCDHKVQAEVIKALAGLRPAVGLEMVSLERQDVLNRFNNGELSVDELQEALNWDETWGHPFRLYKPVFEAVHENGLKLYALNVPKEVMEAVSAGGLEGVVKGDRIYLPTEVVEPAPEQLDELRQIYKGHGHGRKKVEGGDDKAGTFERFILVQSLWDSTMADNAARVRRETGSPVIVLAGSQHVQYGQGIARRVKKFDPGAEVVIVTPWRGGDDAEQDEGDVFFYCPPTHATSAGYTISFRSDGLFISDVEPDSRAEAAGFRIGDRLLGVDGERFETLNGMFRSIIMAARRGETAAYMMERDGGMVVLELENPKPSAPEKDEDRGGLEPTGHEPESEDMDAGGNAPAEPADNPDSSGKDNAGAA